MDWKDVKGMLTTMAPTIAATLGGPLAGTAVTALEGVLGLTPDGSTSDRQNAVVAALSGATPDQLLALKKADLEHAETMAKLGFDNIEKLEALATNDRDSARKREAEVKDKTPRNLAYLITFGFFMVLGVLMFGNVPAGSKEVLYIMLGTLGTAWTGVTAYYFGSSAGSDAKTHLLANSVPADTVKK